MILLKGIVTWPPIEGLLMTIIAIVIFIVLLFLVVFGVMCLAITVRFIITYIKDGPEGIKKLQEKAENNSISHYFKYRAK